VVGKAESLSLKRDSRTDRVTSGVERDARLPASWASVDKPLDGEES
jgi:hypothetical protein